MPTWLVPRPLHLALTLAFGTALLGSQAALAACSGGTIAFGTTATDTCTNKTSGTGSVAAGVGNTTNGKGALALGDANTAAGANTVALGTSASANLANSIAIGASAAATGGSVALGANAVAGAPGSTTATHDTAIGTGATATGGASIAVGSSTASGANAIAIGTGNNVSGANSGAIGDPTTITGTGSYSLGNNNNIASNNAFVVGNGVSLGTGLDGAVVLGNASSVTAATPTASTTIGSTTFTYATAGGNPDAGSVVSVGTPTAPRQVQNVANGQVSGASLDAVNGSQLFGVASTLTTQLGTLGSSLASYLGGGSTYNPTTGTFTAPAYVTYNNNGTTATVNDVGSAIHNLNAQGTQYFHANSTGADSQSRGTDSIAVGTGTIATDTGDVAIGQGATTASNSIIYQGVINHRVGGNVTDPVTGQSMMTPTSTVIGAGSTVLDGGGVAVGSGNTAGGKTFAAIAVGNDNLASGGYAVALGVMNTATNTSSVALGTGNVASGVDSIAIGREAQASGAYAIAQGFVSTATGAGSLALGQAATANNDNDVALGAGSTTSAPTPTSRATVGATLFSGFAGVSPSSVVSVGSVGSERQIQNVAAGRVSAASTDAVNGSQLFAVATGVDANTTHIATVGNSLASSLGGGSAYNPTTGAFTAPSFTVGGATYDDVASALAAQNSIVGNIAGGGGIKYFHVSSSLPDGSAAGSNSVAIGPVSTAIGNGAVSLGNGATANNAGDIALGAGSTTAAAVGTLGASINGTAYGFAGATPTSTLSVGTAGAERTVTNLAAGQLAANSTDAVNGSQLFATNTALGSLGTLTANLGHSVAALQTSLAGSNASLYSNINSSTALHSAPSVTTGIDAVAIGAGSQANHDGDVAIGSGSVTRNAVGTSGVILNGTAYGFAGTTPASTVSVGSAGAERTVTNVAAGQLVAASTDAVNGSQLHATNQAVLALGTTGFNLGASTAASLGGGAAYTAGTGIVGTPAYAVYGTTQTNVGGAVAALQANAPMQYSDKNGVASPVAKSNDVTLVGADATQPVAIHNVAPGVAGTDAVNVNQLAGGLAALSNQVNSSLQNARQDAAGQAAAAMAMAGMPQAFLPGKSMLAVGAATTGGQVGVALGVSTLSDNGKWVYKLNGSTNSRGSVAAGGGVGFQW